MLFLDICTFVPYKWCMQIVSIRHRGLKRFVEENDARGLRPELVNRIRNVLTVLISAADMDGVYGPPGWRIHQLSGDRADTWSISVSGNWRVTFVIEGGRLCNLDLEDYH